LESHMWTCNTVHTLGSSAIWGKGTKPSTKIQRPTLVYFVFFGSSFFPKYGRKDSNLSGRGGWLYVRKTITGCGVMLTFDFFINFLRPEPKSFAKLGSALAA